MLIRDAQPADAKQLTALAFAAKRHWGYSQAAMKSWTRTLTISKRAIRSNPTFVAENGDIRGFCMVSNDGPDWSLEHMWVSPPHMRCGVGSALLAHAIEFIRAREGTELHIDADPNAEKFYCANGAIRVGLIAGPTPEDPHRVRPLLILKISAADESPHAIANRGVTTKTR